MEGYVGIYDPDPDYRGCLTRELSKKQNLPLRTVEFTKPENILAFTRTRRLELLLLPAIALTEELRNADIGRIIVLEEEPVSKEQKKELEQEQLGSLFKYQSVTVLSRELLQMYRLSVEGSAVQLMMPFPAKKTVLGVYSPVKRCLKTSFSIVLAQIMGERDTVLLLSFEAFSALKEMLEQRSGEAERGNLSDVFYYYLQGELPGREEQFIHSCHRFDYIAPAGNPEDLQGLAPEDVLGLIEHFLQTGSYSCIIIDFGDVLQDISRVLSCCSRIFMPTKPDWISVKKRQRFLEYLERGSRELTERICEVQPPYHHISGEGGSFEQLVSGEFYDYVRQCI